MCHFYGWTPGVVETMPLSKYQLFFKSAKMLTATQSIDSIQSASFHAYSENDRTKIMRHLDSMSKRWLFEPIKDFKEVAANLAKKLKEASGG